MPLLNMDAASAIETLKSNGSAMWPRRGEANRLSPIARPKLDPHFTLEPGEKIFTIGSCFARNVERELQARGFELPALDAIKADPDFAAVGTEVLNNYGTPSIYNEIFWALEEDCSDDQVYYPMANKWVDMHLHNRLRPASMETVRHRREAIREAYRQISECRVVIITLGLAEVWIDTETGTYLNAPPRRSMLRESPDRFRLHVLSFDEAAEFLRKALQLIDEHGPNGVRVVLTVSPVPLTATYRPIDVMEANTYSKCVLRVVAEQMRSEFDFVDYYPSYESVTLSERSVAFREDEVHVTPEVVAVNIERMVEAYNGRDTLSIETIRDRIREGKAKELFDLLGNYTEYFEDPEIAGAYVNAALRTHHYEEAETWLDKAADPDGLLNASVAVHNGKPKEALEMLSDQPSDRRLVGQFFRVKMQARLELGQFKEAEKALEEWRKWSPKSYEPFRMMGEFSAKRDPELGRKWYERAYEVSENYPRVSIEYAELLLELGEIEKAQEVAGKITVETVGIQRRVDAVKSAVAVPD